MRTRSFNALGWMSGLAVLLAVAVSPANALLLPFAYFENQGQVDLCDLDTWVEVLDRGNQTVDFVFGNSGAAGVISSVYFEQRCGSEEMLLNPVIIDDPPAVDFQACACPCDPPGSIAGFNDLGPWCGCFFSADAVPPPGDNGVNPGEELTIRFDYAGTFDDVVAALAYPGQFRIAEHVQCVGEGDEFSVWGAAPIPEPAVGVLFLGALFVLWGVRRRVSG